MHEMAHFVEHKSSSHRVSSARLDQTECTLLWRQLPMELSITFKWWWILRLLCAMCWREAPRLASYSPSFDALIRAAKLCIEMIFKASLSTPFCLNGSDGQTLVLVFKPTNNNKIIGERAGRCCCSCRFFVMRCRDTLSPHHYHLFMWNDANAIGADPVQMAAAVDLTHIRQKKSSDYEFNIIFVLGFRFSWRCWPMFSSCLISSFAQHSIFHHTFVFFFILTEFERILCVDKHRLLAIVCVRSRSRTAHPITTLPFEIHRAVWRSSASVGSGNRTTFSPQSTKPIG